MFIDEIVVGVVGTLLVEAFIFIGWVVYMIYRGSKRK